MSVNDLETIKKTISPCPHAQELMPQLYNLQQDSAEANNMIEQFPEIATQMQSKLDQIRLKGSEHVVNSFDN